MSLSKAVQQLKMDHFLFPDELSDLNMVRQELVEYTLHQTSTQSLETLRKLKGYLVLL